MTVEAKYNRLKDEKSAYLLQHKDNPVHWYPYGPEALEASRIENRPIFLSIGYSSCHWCHVMAHESFEDQETADFLNENFICIKVDKEEHPDLDSYYQIACQLFTNSGGWPLSAFLLPDMRPFFVGTYYPKNAGPGRPNFMEILKELHRAFVTDDKLIKENAEKVTEQIEMGLVPQEKVDFKGHYPPPQSILEAVKSFKDTDSGGYGAPPKFPHFAFYDWALEQMLEGMIPKEQGDHIIFSLEKMLFGGIYDHARGGIHRYSVDKEWLVPHFEKMLYDQAGLLKVLSKLGLIYQSPLVYDALNDTLDYLENEMLSENNFFFSAQDADSEGVEGLYFTFTKEEFEDILNGIDENANKDEVSSWFQISEEGNFEKGLNIISLNYDLKDQIYQKENWELIRKIRSGLREERKQRIPPLTDNKGVASWNFMALTALVDVIQYCPIESLVLKATTLFNKALEGVYTSFLTPAPTKDEGSETLRIDKPPQKKDNNRY
ncbi:MAG: thioredoxin domain-containing protein [Bacteriovoracaceae bacterium]